MIYQVKNLKFAYERDRTILNGVDFELDNGELVTILGRNGAGKSTLFSCLLGLQKGVEGEILLEGKDIRSLKERQIAAVVGFVPQVNTPSFGFTVFEFVLMGCASKIGLFSQPGAKEKEDAMTALEEMGITDFADRSYADLSGGERQEVCIARAIASKPKAILFDEPTAHLDYSNQMKVLRIIKRLSEKGYAVAVTSHDPNHALMLGSKAALFSMDGKISIGPVKETVTEEKLKAIYGSDLKIRYMEEFERNVCVYPSL